MNEKNRISSKDDLIYFKNLVEDSSDTGELSVLLESYGFLKEYNKLVDFYEAIHSVEGTRKADVADVVDVVVSKLSSTAGTAVSFAIATYFTKDLLFVDSDCLFFSEIDTSVLSGRHEDKLNFLQGLLKSDVLTVRSSFFSRGSLIRCVLNNEVFYIVSLKTPVDAFYQPSTNKVFYSKHGFLNKNDVVGLIKRYLVYYVRSFEEFKQQFFCDRRVGSLTQIARVDRPYHVFSDEMFSNFILSGSIGEKVPLVYSEEASFFENERVFSLKELQLLGSENILFCSHQRLGFLSSIGQAFLDGIIRRSNNIYAHSSIFCSKVFDGRLVVWISITGGEKPRLINEIEFLSRLIEYFEQKYDNCFFVFDGYTGTEHVGAKGFEFIAQHEKIVQSFVEKFKLSERSLSLVGERLYSKFFYSQFANIVVSSGTPLIWSSNGNKEVRLVIHGGSVMLGKVRDFTRADKILLLSDNYKSWEDVSEGLRFDRVSYELNLDRVVSGLDSFIGGKV